MSLPSSATTAPWRRWPRSPAYPGRLTVIEGDALAADWRHRPAKGPLKIVANLPYNIGTPAADRLADGRAWPPWFASLTLMFQKEVAERIVPPSPARALRPARRAVAVALPVHKLFDVTAGLHAAAQGDLSPSCSSCPKMPCPIGLRCEKLERVTAAAFGQRRKMLRQSLKTVFGVPEAFWSGLASRRTARAEELRE
jgi:16S rRNA (adenine1518-N6/adenine1519-N6)-dimethyltransferase